MDKEFIPYEQALALRKLGFESPYPIGGYQGGKVFYYEKGELYYDGRPMYSSDSHSGQLLAPLYQQAFRWFREKYNLVHTVYSNASGYIWELHYNQERGGTHICDSGESGDCEMSGMFTTYEKAELECLKKLIEIAKK
jgi:hypothetical protein